MCDTFHPLRLSTFARDLDDGTHAYSWYEVPGEMHTYDQDLRWSHVAPLVALTA
jgi:hypothetical protein